MKYKFLFFLAVAAHSTTLLSRVYAQPQQQLSNPIKEIAIGKQVWMAENLSVVTFRNGDTIPEAKTRAEWNRAGHNVNQPGVIIITIPRWELCMVNCTTGLP
jgi:hypothetical protein